MKGFPEVLTREPVQEKVHFQTVVKEGIEVCIFPVITCAVFISIGHPVITCVLCSLVLGGCRLWPWTTPGSTKRIQTLSWMLAILS